MILKIFRNFSLDFFQNISKNEHLSTNCSVKLHEFDWAQIFSNRKVSFVNVKSAQCRWEGVLFFYVKWTTLVRSHVYVMNALTHGSAYAFSLKNERCVQMTSFIRKLWIRSYIWQAGRHIVQLTSYVNTTHTNTFRLGWWLCIRQHTSFFCFIGGLGCTGLGTRHLFSIWY